MIEDILSKEEIEEIYKDIRTNPNYMKHAQAHKNYLLTKQYAKASIEAKVMKEMEIEVFAVLCKERVNLKNIVSEVIQKMNNEDRHYLNIISNSLRMMSDVIEVFIMDANYIMKKYGLNNIREYDKLNTALKEAKACVRTFDKLTEDEKVVSMFGDCSDNLYKLIFNKASSFVNKVKKHEESVNKKAARNAKVA